MTLDQNERGILPRKFLLSFLPSGEALETEISAADAESILDEIRRYSWNRLVHFLSIRERTCRECETFLRGLFLPAIERRQLLSKATEYDYLNDHRYTEMVIHSAANSGKSPRLIRSLLFQAGIDEKLIEETLRAELPEERSDEVRRAHIERLKKRYAREKPQARYRKMLSALSRLGYSWDEIADDMHDLDDTE